MENTFQFTEKAKKHFLKLPETLQLRIKAELKYLKNIDNIKLHLKKIYNVKHAQYRIRIGNYRLIIASIEEDSSGNLLLVNKIAHRRETYKN